MSSGHLDPSQVAKHVCVCNECSNMAMVPKEIGTAQRKASVSPLVLLSGYGELS